jgi:hypothetical protein
MCQRRVQTSSSWVATYQQVDLAHQKRSFKLLSTLNHGPKPSAKKGLYFYLINHLYKSNDRQFYFYK